MEKFEKLNSVEVQAKSYREREAGTVSKVIQSLDGKKIGNSNSIHVCFVIPDVSSSA